MMKLLKSPKVTVTQLAIEIDTQITHHVVIMERVVHDEVTEKSKSSYYLISY